MFAVDSRYQRGQEGEEHEEVPRGEAGPVGRGRITWEGGDGSEENPTSWLLQQTGQPGKEQEK